MSDFFSLADHVALVTGGGRGIGMGIAQRLRSAGARVAVLDSGLGRYESSGRCGRRGVGGYRRRDPPFGRRAGRPRGGSGPGPEFGILVNNAGITGRTDLSWNLTLDEMRLVLDVNVLGPFLFCKAAVPGMLAREYGRILNVASIAGKEGNPTLLPYSASKAAVIAMTKSLAKELAGKGDLTVNAISPAVIRTPILEGMAPSTVDYMISKIPMGRTGTIEEVAALVHYLASPEASFTTGQCYDISGGRATY